MILSLSDYFCSIIIVLILCKSKSNKKWNATHDTPVSFVFFPPRILVPPGPHPIFALNSAPTIVVMCNYFCVNATKRSRANTILIDRKMKLKKKPKKRQDTSFFVNSKVIAKCEKVCVVTTNNGPVLHLPELSNFDVCCYKCKRRYHILKYRLFSRTFD